MTENIRRNQNKLLPTRPIFPRRIFYMTHFPASCHRINFFVMLFVLASFSCITKPILFVLPIIIIIDAAGLSYLLKYELNKRF